MNNSYRKLPRTILRCSARRHQASLKSLGRRWESTGVGVTGRQWSTPLAKSLGEAITTTGPIPLAAYMRQCLTSPNGGYYSRWSGEGRDQFGVKGDFTTSPEISQVFGELIGVWVVAEWIAQGKPKPIQLIELGPGRGTLMADMLRTIKQFEPMIKSVYLVESSAQLRQKQCDLLSNGAALTENEAGWEALNQYLPEQKISWVEDLKMVPKDESSAPFIIAHEFFDALPIHAFQVVESKSSRLTVSSSPGLSSRPQNEWRELLVAPTSPRMEFTRSRSSQRGSDDAEPEFTMVVSKGPTPFSQYLPNSSNRYKDILSTLGANIEISPESLALAADIAVRIGGERADSTKTSAVQVRETQQPTGAALIIDYGPSSTIPRNSLRGIRNHRIVSPFASPGLVDISADVDFTALAEAALNASAGVEVHSPLEQASFLSAMGIKERSEMLIEEARKGSDEEAAKRIESECSRLIDRSPQGMGRLYKAMAIVPHQAGRLRRPVGFGGDVTG